jgi:hypothetical protein
MVADHREAFCFAHPFSDALGVTCEADRFEWMAMRMAANATYV